jgi:hypothetical protein
MGRELTALTRWRGVQAEAKVLLESTELILRGAHKARLSRAALANWRAADDGLHLMADGEPLYIAMSQLDANRWIKALGTPPPSLAVKLGVGPDRPVRLIGRAGDVALAEALTGACSDQAAQLLAVIEDPAGLSQALTAAYAAPDLPIWCVYPKGKAADPGDAAIRSAFRAAGWTDSKSCAVSDRLTAMRYMIKR